MWLLIPALVGVLGAQAPPRDAPAVREGTAVIRGRVVAADTGAPIRACSVTASTTDAPLRSARTDQDGRFEFAKLPAGAYRLAADPGRSSVVYLPAFYGSSEPRSLGKPLTVAEGQILERIELRLMRGGVISGRVVDDLGEPVAYARVSALERPPGGLEPRRAEGMFMPAQTDDLGRFRIFALRAGDYYLVAEPFDAGARSYGQSRISAAPRALTTYYPSATNTLDAVSIRLRAGQEISELEIRLFYGRTFKVTGMVMNSRGEPARRLSVSLTRRTVDGTAGFGVEVKPDGSFEVREVASGSYTIRAGPPRSGSDGARTPTDEYASVPVTVADADVEGVVVVTEPARPSPARSSTMTRRPANASTWHSRRSRAFGGSTSSPRQPGRRWATTARSCSMACLGPG